MAMLALTAFHDIMKVQSPTPVSDHSLSHCDVPLADRCCLCTICLPQVRLYFSIATPKSPPHIIPSLRLTTTTNNTTFIPQVAGAKAPIIHAENDVIGDHDIALDMSRLPSRVCLRMRA